MLQNSLPRLLGFIPTTPAPLWCVSLVPRGSLLCESTADEACPVQRVCCADVHDCPGVASPMELKHEQELDELHAAIAAERQQQRPQGRLLSEGHERAVVAVADTLHQ